MNTENIGFIIVLTVAIVVAWGILRTRYLHEFVVNDGLIGLIYRNGKLMEAVKAGRHFRWGKAYRIALIDARNTLLPVAGQEVLSADGISIKISVVVTSQVIDAIKAVQTVDNYTAHLYKRSAKRSARGDGWSDNGRADHICSVNARMENLDPAILRPGRLMNHRRFKLLPSATAAQIAVRKKIAFRPRPDVAEYSLADVLNPGAKLQPKERRHIGFRRRITV